MSSKENYCYRILKAYSLIVDFDGIPSRENVPAPVEGETYGHWKERVLGSHVSNVVLYAPKEPANQTRVSTLQNQAGADHLEKMFRSFEKTKKEQRNSAVNAAIEETGRKLTTFSRDTLEGLITGSDEIFEPSVTEFLDRYLRAVDPDVDIENLILGLLKAYNGAVRKYRERG
jgi:hypothetical protein